MLLLPALPALAGPQAGGELYANGQGTNRGVGVGPSAPGVDWQTVLPEFENFNIDMPPLLDGEGHVLVVVNEVEAMGDPDLADWMVALDAEDGSEVWRTEGVMGECVPAVSDSGDIFAMAEVVAGPSEIIRIDATDGTITERFPETDAFEFRDCRGASGLRLAQGDVLLLPHGEGGAKVSAFTTSDSIEFAFELDVPAGFWPQSVVLSPDGSMGFFPWYDDDTTEMGVLSFDVTDGSEIDRLTFPFENYGSSWRVHAHDGSGILISYGYVVQLLRVAATDAGELSLDWSVVFSRNSDVDESGVENYLSSNLYVVTDDVLVTTMAGTADLVAVALDSGEVQWEFATNGSPLVADANGDIYTNGGRSHALVSVNSQGEARWETENSAAFWAGFTMNRLGAVTEAGQLIATGTDAEGVFAVTAVANSATRLSGGAASTPINVAIQTCEFMFPEDDSAAGVLLARDDVFADALTGAPLAGDHSCMLYTPGGPGATLDPATRAEINRVLADGAPVTILGGTNAVSQAVEDELRASGYDVTRLSGASRFDTAIEIARVVRAQHPEETRTALAFSHNWPDAVTGGAWAAVEGVPVLLTQSDQLTAQTDAELDRLGTTETIVFGGAAVISEQAANAAPNPTRYFGRNRYATAAEIADGLWSSVPNQGGAFVLTNLHHEDGWAFSLSAVPVSVRLVAPQLGVQAQLYPEDTAAYLRARGFDVAAGLVVLGDVTVISDDVVDQVAGDVGQ